MSYFFVLVSCTVTVGGETNMREREGGEKNMKQLLTIKEVADLLNMSVDGTYALARQGIFPVIRIGRQLRVNPEQFKEWIDFGGKKREVQ
jgi:excisionase family DNA binding protein